MEVAGIQSSTTGRSNLLRSTHGVVILHIARNKHIVAEWVLVLPYRCDDSTTNHIDAWGVT